MSAVPGSTRPGWRIEHHSATAGELHARPIPAAPTATAWLFEASGPALVLGSTESEEHVDVERVAAAGIEVVRRRSGGGAVLVLPGRCTWLDLVVPSDHELWEVDVGRAVHWVGDLWRAACADLGIDAEVHRGAMQRTRWSRHVCFSGVGPGEVRDAEGRKVVGISQRRTRAAARFQSVAYHGAAVSEIADLLDLDGADRAALTAELDATTASLPVTPEAMTVALVENLPRA